MSEILKHVQAQQDALHRLDALLRALVELNINKLAPGTQAELMGAALHMCSETARALDYTNLPDEVHCMNHSALSEGLFDAAPVGATPGAAVGVSASADPIISLCNAHIAAWEEWEVECGDLKIGFETPRLLELDAIKSALDEQIRRTPILTDAGCAVFWEYVHRDNYLHDLSQDFPDVQRWQLDKLRDWIEARANAGGVDGNAPDQQSAPAPADTPVMRLFREWEAARKAYNDFDGDDCDEWPRMKLAEDRLLATPPQTVTDYAAKLVVLNDFVGLEGVAWGDAMLAEARALVGGAA